MNIMVDRKQLIETLNSKGDINYVIGDYLCVEFNKTQQQANLFIELLNQYGTTNIFVEGVLKYYMHKLGINSVQKHNNNHQKTLFGFELIPEWETIYYY